MYTTLIKTADHIDDVVTEAYELFAQRFCVNPESKTILFYKLGFCVNPESKAILFYNENLEVFLIAYAVDLDLEEVKTGVFNRFRELDEIH